MTRRMVSDPPAARGELEQMIEDVKTSGTDFPMFGDGPTGLAIYTLQHMQDLIRARAGRRAEEAAKSKQPEPIPDATDTPIAAREPPRAASAANGYRGAPGQRLADALERLAMSQGRFAQHANTNQASISKFLAGRGVSRPTRAGIEAALADLAGYA